jgi:drug/metabolite transporter (DMT)-like permease
VKATSASLPKKWRPKAGWGVPLAWLTLCVVWSSTWLAIKIGLRDLPPISFVAIRFLIAIIVLVAVSMGRTHLFPRTRSDYLVLAVTGILMFAVNYTLLFWAELHVSSGLAAVLQATIPIFGMMFAHWMLPDEPLRLQKLAGAIVALGGVTVICGRLLGFNGTLAFWGGVAVVVGAASAAFANVLVKARSMQVAPAMLAASSAASAFGPVVSVG